MTASGQLGQFEGQSSIGAVPHTGSCDFDTEKDAYTIIGARAMPETDADAGHFVWKHMTGDFIVTARATFRDASGNPQHTLGLMARSITDGSAHVRTGIYGDGRLALQFQRAPVSPTEAVDASLTGADVFQLERKGTTYSLSVARFGEPFVTRQITDIDLGDSVYVGLFVGTQTAAGVEATFRNVRIVVPVKDGFNRETDPFGSRLEILDVVRGDRRIVYSSDTVCEAPNWTRDGTALIYNSHGRLYRFDLATKTPTLIDTGDVVRNNNDHVLSFDGTMLAISSHSDKGHDSLVYTVPVQGGQPQRITPIGPSYLHGWSPDGQYLVYTGQRNGTYDIYRCGVAGGTETQLTHTPGLDDGPEYTPDGKYIYFNSVRSGRMQIWRMKPDGSDPQQLTDDEYNNWFPHISPDGTSVVFVTYLVNEVEPSDHPPAKRVYLRLMPLDGGTPKVIAYLYGGQGTMNVPSWSPDGTQVAFVSNTVP